MCYQYLFPAELALFGVWILVKSKICDGLRDLVSFVQIKKREKHLWRSVSFNSYRLLKVTLLHVCFVYFLNCRNGTKLRKTSLMCNGGFEQTNNRICKENFLKNIFMKRDSRSQKSKHSLKSQARKFLKSYQTNVDERDHSCYTWECASCNFLELDWIKIIIWQLRPRGFTDSSNNLVAV